MKKLPPPTPGTRGTDDPADTLAALAPVARSSVVDAVADRLRGEILAGRIAAGSRLPSERELSLALGVNRLTLRAALARLEAMGLVTTRHGSGTEVASWRERAGLEALAMVLSSLQVGEPAWVELLTSLLEVRRILVSEAIALAAVRHTAEDIANMRAIADDLKTRLHDPLAFSRGDLMFQRAVIRAARNVGLELMLNSFVRFPEELPDLVAQLYDRRHESLPLYDVVIDLVKSGDGAAARTAALMAFAAIDEEWLKRHGHTMFSSASTSAASAEKRGKLASPANNNKKRKAKKSR